MPPALIDFHGAAEHIVAICTRYQGREVMKAHTAMLAIFLAAPLSVSQAQFARDPPWNAEHIDRLPPDVRSAVLAKCPTRPDAGHYFATYFHDEVHLHYEHLHCAGASFCNASGCLHQTFKLSAGHYHLAKTAYGSRND